MKMKDVAQRAGVSAATVSRVLNGVDTVRSDYRDRVLAVIEDMGYTPNRLASNLRRQKAETIGVVVSDIENPHFTGMVRAVENAAYRRGYRVMLCNTDETTEKQRSYLQVLAAERVQGVIIAPSDPEGPEISGLLDLGVPVVAFDRTVGDHRADAVVADSVGGLRRATKHLIDLGHTQIGFVGGPVGVETGKDRLEGYRATMLAAGLEPRWADGRFRIKEGKGAAESLLADGLTALVIANNLMTIGALEALRERGMRVPGDVALVAVDDPFWAKLVEPSLTTLAQPVREMAQSAFEMVLKRITDGFDESRRIVFDFELVVRGSCGTARGGS